MKLGTNDIGSVYLGTNAVQKVYLGTNEVWSSKPTVSDADAQAFIDRVYAAGGTLSTTEGDAVNTLVIDMKADGIWTKMKAIYPMVGASAASCAQNLKSSSFTGSFTIGWTFASTGVTPNGTSDYMDTGIVPSSDLTLNSTHLSLYSRTDAGANSYDYNAGTGLQITPKWGNTNNYYSINSTETSGGSIASSLGFFTASRIVSTVHKIFQNGIAFNTTTKNSTSLPTVNLICGARNNGGGSFSSYSSRQFALLSCGDGLSDTEASDFYDAVQAFQTTLSRNV